MLFMLLRKSLKIHCLLTNEIFNKMADYLVKTQSLRQHAVSLHKAQYGSTIIFFRANINADF